MKKSLQMSLVLLIVLTILSGCKFEPLSEGPQTPEICDSKRNITEAEVQSDIDANEEEFRDFITLTAYEDLQIFRILYQEGEDIQVLAYIGTKEEYLNDKFNVAVYNLDDIEEISSTDKDLIRTFILNRNSKLVQIDKDFDDTTTYMTVEYFGLTYVRYMNDEFTVAKGRCTGSRTQ